MRVDRFDYALPTELIAQAPTPEREQARLLVVPRTTPGQRTGRSPSSPSTSPRGRLVVVNDTKVLPARILGTKEGTGGKTRDLPRAEARRRRRAAAARRASAGGRSARASKALRPGTRIVKDALVVEFEGKAEDGLFEVRLSTRDGSSIDEARSRRPDRSRCRRTSSATSRPEDEQRYQTVFARAEGAVAAPTAGLHLTQALLKRLESRGCEIATCTLHVGLGTFQPVTVDDLDDHPMHAEYFEVPRALAAAIARARERGAPVLAVGTTVVRALESAADPERPRARPRVRRGDADPHPARLPLSRSSIGCSRTSTFRSRRCSRSSARSRAPSACSSAYAIAVKEQLPLLLVRRRDAARPRGSRGAR